MEDMISCLVILIAIAGLMALPLLASNLGAHNEPKPTEVSTEAPTEIPTEMPTEPPTEPVTEPAPTESTWPEEVKWYSDYRVYPTGKVTTTAGGYSFDIEFLAKLLYCEARGMTWVGQVYTCSAILNYCDVQRHSLWDAGHDRNCFEPAPFVDKVKPNKMQYEVIDYVLNGGRIGEICYFRSGGKYHSFGIPVCEVDGHYFSIERYRK